jgi:flagellar basal-body rod modification protein FlgD
MATVTPTSSGSSLETAVASRDGANLGKDDFLKLLTTQLTHQDPMSPVDDKEFIGTMAQFSALEQTSNMAKGLERLTFASQLSQSVGLIGHSVKYTDGDATSTGTVKSVSVTDGKIAISIGTKTVTPDAIVEVS